jgi:hypothetical protein
MKKTYKKIISFSLLSVFVFIAGLTSLLFFPQNLFGKFKVYYDKNAEVAGINTILDKAYALVQTSELFDRYKDFDIFLAEGNIINSIENLQGNNAYARATADNIFIKFQPDFLSPNFFIGKNKIKFSELIAHEMVHVLQAHRYGLLNFSPIKHPDFWKVEGYPEYISRVSILQKKDYSLAKEVFRYKNEIANAKNEIVNISENYFAPQVYYKGRIMVEYLIKEKGMTYDEILKDKRSADEIFAEIEEWAEQQTKQRKE